MPYYATLDDIETLYGSDALYVAGRDGVVDEGAIARALVSAASEINTYIGVRYPLPLKSNPDILIQHSVDIALYRLANTRGASTDEHRKRYDDAISHLVKIGKGTAALPKEATSESSENGAPKVQSGAVVISGSPRLFRRKDTREF